MPLALLLLAAESPVVPGAKLTQIGTGYAFTEGPARAKNGDVLFTDQPNDRIVRWDGSRFSDWMKPAGRANGMAFDTKGNLIVCADGKNELWSISPTGEKTVLVKDYHGGLLNGPNDVWVRSDDSLYVTDPLYARDYWTRSKARQQPGEYVYYVSPDRKYVRPVATDLKQPNGIVGTPDGNTLYVSDIGAGVTYRYHIEPNGTLSAKSEFCKLGSDGMSIDEKGDVYLTGHGVTVFDPSGTQIEHIDVPESWTANVTFAGKDRKTLFVTASKSVYTLKMRVAGAD